MIALKKLENVKKDHEKRIMNLEISQAEDIKKAELISRNQKLVDDVILTVRQAVASQMSWTDIENLIKEATHGGDSVASIIKQLKLNINHITLFLSLVLFYLISKNILYINTKLSFLLIFCNFIVRYFLEIHMTIMMKMVKLYSNQALLMLI